MNNNNLSIVTSRIVDADIERAWAAWTEPEQVAQWWGPAGFTNTVQEMDVRPGGRWTILMHGPDGTDYPNSSTYGEVTRLKKLEILHAESKEFGIAAWRAEVTFEEIDGKTSVTMAGIFLSVEDKTKHVEEFHAIEGAEETMTRMTEFLKSTT
jgi:uncharacterized protein YndB with AHSA1/START domain